MRIPTFPLWLFEILIGPAHIWIWICSKLCGVTIECETFDETEDGHE